MKRLLVLALTSMVCALSAQQAINGQNPPGCLSDQLRLEKMNNSPGYRARLQQMDNSILQVQQSMQNARMATTIYTIPVVVHIIHNNGPENISNAQVIQGITDLNNAFANAGPYQDANGTDMQIQFCLAQQDENGNASTGIDRVVSTLTNMTAETDDLALKNLTRWDPTKYLNIWLVKEITSQAMGPGVAGYAYLPASHGQPEDGVVNEARWFGSDVNNSKIHIHEVGHYLGLYHTFEGGCVNNDCTLDGDKVCDTPPDNSTSAVACSSAPNSCTTDDDDLSANNPFRPVANGGLGDQPDMIEDYMDYGFQYCQSRFTAGQRDRMIAALTTTRASLLSSIGCQSLCTLPISIGFTASSTTVFMNNTVNFTNTTTGGTTFTWDVNGNPFATTTNASYLFTTPGYYIVTLTAENSDSVCMRQFSDTIHVLCGAQASFTTSPAGPYNPGATLTFTNTSSGATSYSWYLDGVYQTSTTNFSHTFNNAGGHYVYLVADNGTCADTSASNFFQVGSCNLSEMTNHWFLVGSSMDFTSGSPVVGTSPIATANLECTSTISDANGNLLFYTDGISVWNRNNQVMPNGTGLMAHWSSTQCVLITPDPGNSNRYYIFTTGAIENSYANGFRYSIVDMTLDGGLGDVTATKNVLIAASMGEKVSATWHSNGQDIWVATHSVTGTTFYAYLLTSAGLNMTPVTSTAGISCDMGLGSIRFSQDGIHCAANILTNNIPRYTTITDFNRTTGQFTNAINVPFSSATWEQPYDVEFSPDGSKIYVSLVNYGRVYQIDLAAGGPSAIIASKMIVDTYANFTAFGHLALAKNGKIYVAGPGSSTLDVINNPNLAGAACNYQQNGVTLLGNNNNWALPNMINGLLQSHSVIISGPASICSGATTHYSLVHASVADSAAWSLHGPGQLVMPSDTAINLTGTTPGINDTIIVTYYGSCGLSFDSIIVQNNPALNISLGNDTALCTNPTILTPGGGFVSYQWQNNSNGFTFAATSPGTYWVKVTNAAGCTASDTIVLSANPNVPPLNLGNDISVCLGHTVVLQPSASYSHYTWQDGTHNSTFTAYLPGTYWLNVSATCYTGVDTIHVYADESAIPLDLGPDTIVCSSDFPFTLHATPGYLSYLWQDSSTATSFVVNGFGQYWVTITDSTGCSSRDTIEVFNCVSVHSPEENSISIFPNPADASLTFDIPGNEKAVVLLYSNSGQLVAKKEFAAGEIKILSTSEFTEGLYMIEVQTGNAVLHEKLLILHR